MTKLPTVVEDFDTIRIKFGGVLHVLIRKDLLVGVQTWVWGKHKFCIEYTFQQGAPVLSEYDRWETFEHILKRLDEIL